MSRSALTLAALCVAGVAQAATLTFTTPRTYVTGDTLSDGYRQWQLAYTTQSKTWVAKRAVMAASPDSFAYYWPSVRSEAAPRVVLVGWARPGQSVSQVAPPVISLDWPFTWWVRYYTDVPGPWSNPTASQVGN
jgi:hypothetical protein